jgi:Iap family predicted aminopeptidase
MHSNSDRLLREIGGRLSGTPAGNEAQALVRQRLEDMGMDEVKIEPFPLQCWERNEVLLERTAPRKKPLDALALGLSCGTGKEGLVGPVKDMGYGDPHELRARAREIEGRFVLLKEGGVKGQRAFHRGVKMSAAQDAGALGLLLMSGEEGDLPKTGTCQYNRISRIPGAGISLEEGLAMARLLADGQEVGIRLVMDNGASQGEASNIIGFLEGREKTEEFVYAGAHLDAWDVAEGAMDNGSGVLTLLEAARALARLPGRPRRSLAFCFFMGEESGLCGSSHYVKHHDATLNGVVSYLNLDIVNAPIRLNAGGEQARFPLLGPITRSLSPLGVEPKISSDFHLHSDHRAFLLAGIPTLSWECRFREGTLKYCHSRADTADKLDYGGLHLCAGASAALLYALAEAPERPAERLTPRETRKLLEDAGLRGELEAEGDWPF